MVTNVKSRIAPVAQRLFGSPPSPDEEQLERYPKQVRILHWVTAVTWIALFITGLFLFVPPFGGAAVGGWSGLLHRIAAVVVVGWAIVYFLMNMKTALEGITEAFKWGKEDIKWAMAAPYYYFFGQEEKMPPQGHMNTGQKIWWLTVLAAGALMVITGALMWFFKGMISNDAFLWVSTFHAIGMAVLLPFSILHVYLSVIHPKMRGIFWSMWGGMVSAKYAESHHKKWYDEIKKG